MKRPVTLILALIIVVMTIGHFAFQSYVRKELKILVLDQVQKPGTDADFTFKKIKIKPFRAAGTAYDAELKIGSMSFLIKEIDFNISKGELRAKNIRGSFSMLPYSIEQYSLQDYKKTKGIPVSSNVLIKNFSALIPHPDLKYFIEDAQVVINMDSSYKASVKNKSVEIDIKSFEVKNMFDFKIRILMNNVDFDFFKSSISGEYKSARDRMLQEMISNSEVSDLEIEFHNFDFINSLYRYMDREGSEKTSAQFIKEMKETAEKKYGSKEASEFKKLNDGMMKLFERKANRLKVRFIFSEKLQLKDLQKYAYLRDFPPESKISLEVSVK